jgi:hypothetical protein
LLLLGTSGCHLCEQAELVLHCSVPEDFNLLIESIDIAEFEHWQLRYAERIPVLYHPETEQELGWPFDQKQVKNFISELYHG